MLTRFGWTRVRDARNTNSPRRSPRRLRLETLEQRTLMVGDLVVELPDEFFGNADGWHEGEILDITGLVVTENGEPVSQPTLDIVRWEYVFTDTANNQSVPVPVGLGTHPNIPVPWETFAAFDGYTDVFVTLAAFDLNDNEIPLGFQTTISLENGVPIIANIAHDTSGGGGGCGGGSGPFIVTLTADIGDPSSADAFTTTIDWGDGSGVVPFQSGDSHPYASGGEYFVTITATDDDHLNVGNGETVTDPPYELHLVGGGPSVCFDSDTGTITVTGSDSGDTVVVNAPNGNVRVSASFLPGPSQFVQFPAASVTKIVALLGDGNDVFTVSGNVSLPIVAVGGAGDDTLAGGRFRNILIGGIGADTLYGGRGEDVLIGGSTDHDASSAALLSLLAEWTSNHSLEDRVRNLVNGSGSVSGLNGAIFLSETGGTVHDDGDVDTLLSGSGTDWLFLNGTAENLLAQGSNHDLLGDDLDGLFD